ncbi:MAG: hypothetical protein JNM39_11190 [Bdellovibrionaceae bacterium]|nr:hypothetical protein [Pseudobdellovibrionaceae bacterium]
MKIATLSTSRILAAFLLLTSSISVQAEIRPPGAVLETSCAINRQMPSEITQICFAQVIGLQGEFVTTRNFDGITSVWKVTQRIESSENDQTDEKIVDNLELVSVGYLKNRFLVREENAEVLTASLAQMTCLLDGSIEVEGSLGHQPIRASKFQTFFFTMGQTELDF